METSPAVSKAPRHLRPTASFGLVRDVRAKAELADYATRLGSSTSSLPGLRDHSTPSARNIVPSFAGNRRTLSSKLSDSTEYLRGHRVRPCEFTLGERGVPEGREDSASFTSSHEDLAQCSKLDWEPLASSSVLVPTIRKVDGLQLPNFVRERLQNRIKRALPIPAVEENPSVTEDSSSELEKRASNVFSVFTDWLSQSTPIPLRINNECLDFESGPVSWSEVDCVSLSRDSGVIQLPSCTLYVPDRGTSLHLCSSIAHRLRNRPAAVVTSKESSLFLATCAIRHLAARRYSASSNPTKKSSATKCWWKSLKPRGAAKWTSGFVEVTENEIFFSESLEKVPVLVLSHLRRASDVRLVEIAEESSPSGKTVLRIGVEVFLAVEKPEFMLETLQESCTRKMQLKEFVAVKPAEEKVFIRLKKLCLEVTYVAEKFNVEYTDVAAVNTHESNDSCCFLVLKHSEGGEMPVLIFAFHGLLEKNAFLRRLCQSTSFLEYSSVATIPLNDDLLNFESRIFRKSGNELEGV